MQTLLVRVCGMFNSPIWFSKGSAGSAQCMVLRCRLPLKQLTMALAQVAETEAQLARRLVDRKTEPLVRAL